MATEGLPDAPPVLTFDEVRVRRTVAAGHTISRAVAANLTALARPARHFCTAQTAVYNVSVSYRRSHTAIKYLYLAAFTRSPSPFSSTETMTINLAITDAGGHSVASSASTIPRGFRSGTTYQPALVSFNPLAQFVQLTEGFLDLDALAVTLTDPSWSLDITVTRSGSTLVLDRIEGFEVPRTQVNSADDYGILTGLLNPGNVVVAGSTTTYGYERLNKTTEAAILAGRDYVNVAWPADIAYGLSPRTTSATYVPLTNLTDGSNALPFYCYPRVVYAPNSSSGERMRWRVLFYVSGGGTADFQLTTGAASSPYTVTGLTGAAWAWSAWTDGYLPTNGTDRIAEITIKGRTSAGTVYLAGLHAQENP